MVCVTVGTSCAYRMGSGERSIPGGYKQVSVPVFKNKTQETGIEVGFTKSLINEFQRSRIARVVEKPLSEVSVVGSIDSVSYQPGQKESPATQHLLIFQMGLSLLQSIVFY